MSIRDSTRCLRTSHSSCGPRRPARVQTLQDKAESLMATNGQLFEEMMVTYHTLGIAEPLLELHVLDVPGAHCLCSRRGMWQPVASRWLLPCSLSLRKQGDIDIVFFSRTTTLWGMSPFEVAESVNGRPKDNSSWTGSDSECRDAVCVGFSQRRCGKVPVRSCRECHRKT